MFLNLVWMIETNYYCQILEIRKYSFVHLSRLLGKPRKTNSIFLLKDSIAVFLICSVF